MQINQSKANRSAALGAVEFAHPVAFWFGVVAVIAGVLAHLPMYLMGRNMGYRPAGMPMDTSMGTRDAVDRVHFPDRRHRDDVERVSDFHVRHRNTQTPIGGDR